MPVNKDKIFSKKLTSNDQSGFDFVQEMLNGDATFGINFDRVQWDNKHKKYVVIELLLCDEKQNVDPYTSHPNRYFFSKKEKSIIGNGRKFIKLWELSLKLEANLFLVNYAKKGTLHEDKVLLMWVINVDKNNKTTPVRTKDIKFTRDEFSTKFREMNERGRDDNSIGEN